LFWRSLEKVPFFVFWYNFCIQNLFFLGHKEMKINQIDMKKKKYNQPRKRRRSPIIVSIRNTSSSTKLTPVNSFSVSFLIAFINIWLLFHRRIQLRLIIERKNFWKHQVQFVMSIVWNKTIDHQYSIYQKIQSFIKILKRNVEDVCIVDVYFIFWLLGFLLSYVLLRSFSFYFYGNHQVKTKIHKYHSFPSSFSSNCNL